MSIRPGLRERQKAQTRQRISDVATRLIRARGFDHVTIADIAEAADVSKMTVSNYFPRKEDLYLDRFPEAEALLADAVRGRAAGESPLAALRRLLLDLHAQGHPLGGLSDTFASFWRIVLESAPLRARAREALDELEDALAALLREAGDPEPRLAAALTVAAYRSAYAATYDRLLAGERAADLHAGHVDLVHRAYDAVERALTDRYHSCT